VLWPNKTSKKCHKTAARNVNYYFMCKSLFSAAKMNNNTAENILFFVEIDVSYFMPFGSLKMDCFDE